MGRERQKQKNRSGRSKVRQRPKSKKKVLHNPIIAANWDKDQTLSQNYRRLGLTAKLNRSTGGIEKKGSDIKPADEDVEIAETDVDTLAIGETINTNQLGLTEAKVERDSKTGRILRVISDESQTRRPNPLNDPLNELDSESDFEEERPPSDGRDGLQPKTDVIRQLEEQANMPEAKYKRKQSENERAFIKELVQKHGDDYGKMARDMKLNYMQRSAGDLKRRIKIWREAGAVTG